MYAMSTQDVQAHVQSAVQNHTAASSNVHIERVGNRITFCAPVTHESVFKLVQKLREAETECLKQVAAAKLDLLVTTTKHPDVKIDVKPSPIELSITTYGGGVHAAFSAVDVILGLKVPVHTHVCGYVASAGTLISLAGAKRTMGRNAYMLIHQVRGGTWGTHSNIVDDFGNIDMLHKHITRYYVERTKLDEATLADVLARDRNWDVQQCLDHGVITHRDE